MRKIIVFTLTFLLAAVAANAQQQIAENRPMDAPSVATTSSTVAEPEWPGTVELLLEGKLFSLESRKLIHEINSKAMGFRGGQEIFYVDGITSPFTTSSTPEFVITMEIKSNPSTQISIDRVEVTKKTRQVVVTSLKGSFGGSNKTSPDQNLPLNFVRYGTKSIKFSPVSPLSPGEYMITTTADAGKAHLFRVQ